MAGDAGGVVLELSPVTAPCPGTPPPPHRALPARCPQIGAAQGAVAGSPPTQDGGCVPDPNEAGHRLWEQASFPGGGGAVETPGPSMEPPASLGTRPRAGPPAGQQQGSGGASRSPGGA